MQASDTNPTKPRRYRTASSYSFADRLEDEPDRPKRLTFEEASAILAGKKPDKPETA